MDSPYPAPPPAPPRPALDGFAVAALVAGLLCGLPVVGVVLGAVALSRIKRTGDRGKGLAVTGLVLSALGTLYLAVMAAGGAFQSGEGAEDGSFAGSRGGGSFALHKGDCVDTPHDDLVDRIARTAVAPCARTHTAEVFGVFELPGGGYPGEDSISEAAESRCWRLTSAYAMDTWAFPKDVEVYYLAPSSESWVWGDRQVSCLFGRDEGPLKGSLRQDETTLDEHQVAYLKAVNTFDDAKAEAPEAEYVEDDLAAYKQWAENVTAALDEEARILRAHEWPADVRQHVAAIDAEIAAARPLWAKAAKAKDADTYYDHYEAAEDLSGDVDAAVKARAALGLATSAPAADAEV
ncbi:DUF4190 domain-containing protein [Actinacidiphila glaucinigra]|uniref:DUF4190 domain-containing protein n=1 Tax=Actinacidiphila glaucinigra TaxID=235986 RepID=UPI0036BF214E